VPIRIAALHKYLNIGCFLIFGLAKGPRNGAIIVTLAHSSAAIFDLDQVIPRLGGASQPVTTLLIIAVRLRIFAEPITSSTLAPTAPGNHA
jgi:hypothetical protein